jgi:hypothetical protein
MLQSFLLMSLLSGLSPGLRAAPVGPLAAEAPVRAQAPDGERGLGADARLATLLALFRQPTDEDEAFLRGLRELLRSVEILARTTEGLYRGRRAFDLLEGRQSPDLATLHASFRAFLVDPAPALATGDARARAFARLLLDARFRARASVLEDWRRDAEEVRRGLALLHAETDGFVRLRESEGRTIARRVDLAAALLRARFKDLEALRESQGSASEVHAEDVERLLALAREGGSLAPVLAQADERVQRLRSVLFTTRLVRAVQAELDWRAEADRGARQAADDAFLWLPDTREGSEAPPEIARFKKTTRRREGYLRAQECLSKDPFDDRVAYAAAVAARAIAGTVQALDFYDRFLALRGIREYDDRTWRLKGLTDEEGEAIVFLQQNAGSGPPPSGEAGGGSGGE